MIILLPLLMMEVPVGQEIHEWLGTGMILLFLIHQALNAGWWKGFYKGKYTPSRAFVVTIDLLLLLDFLALFGSGIMMSGFVFDFLPIRGGMVTARSLHLFASHWGFLLMSVHLGMHMEMFMGIARKLLHISGNNTARTWILRFIALAGSTYGIYAFINQHIVEYLFLQTHFVMFDETKPVFLYLAENIAMIWLFAAVGHYLSKFLRLAASKSKKGESSKTVWKVCSFAIPFLACVLVTAELTKPW